MASRRFTVDSAKKNKFVDIFLLMPETGVADAMRSAKSNEEDIADLQMRRFLQRALPGGSIKGLKAYVAGLLCPMRLVDDAAIVVNVEAAIVHVECTPPVTVNAIVNVKPRTIRQSMAVSLATQFNRQLTSLIVAIELCHCNNADDCLVGDNARGRPELTQLTRREEGGGGAMARKAV
jgi:hypothetical protein